MHCLSTCILFFINTVVPLVIIKLHSWLCSLIISDSVSMLFDAQHGRRRHGAGSCEEKRHILTLNSRGFPVSQPLVYFCLAWCVANSSLPGWLIGDIWIVLVGRVGWDLNRSLSSVDTGVRKWFWFHPSCLDREEKWWFEELEKCWMSENFCVAS